MICPNCKANVPAGDEFCVECGFDLRPANAICPKCGALYKPDDVFCGACGARLTPETRGEEPEFESAREILAAEKTVVIDKKDNIFIQAKGTALSHELVKEIASSNEYNNLSPLFALNPVEKQKRKMDIPLESKILNAILMPSKSFCLTAVAGNRLYQKILLVRDSTYCRWEDEGNTVLVNPEKSPRDFIDYIYGVISSDLQGNENSVVVLKQEQLLILKAVNSFCRALSQARLNTTFVIYDHLKNYLKTDDKLKAQLGTLSKNGMVSITGTDNPLITLETKGNVIIGALENYDALYILQVSAGGKDEFSSVNLLRKNCLVYSVSNPKNGDEVVLRTLDRTALRSILNWMWTSV